MKTTSQTNTSTLLNRINSEGDLVLSPLLGMDTLTALGAKVSRAPDGGVSSRLEELIQECESNNEPHPLQLGNELSWLDSTPPSVQRFIDTNLKGYGHASPADMSHPAIYINDISWTAAWLIEDDPLWAGQENSTRAVKRTSGWGPSRLAPKEAIDLHQRWMDVYESEVERYTAACPSDIKGYAKTSWILDRARWSLPGTTKTGVLTVAPLRATQRHFDRLCGHPEEFVKQVGALGTTLNRAAAPLTTDARIKNRTAPFNLTSSPRITPMHKPGWTFVKSTAVQDSSWRTIPPRTGPGEYLDSMWNWVYPKVTVGFRTSIASARDMHRHRMMMPWVLDVFADRGSPVLEPISCPLGTPEPIVDKKLWQDTRETWLQLKNEGRHWEALQCLPFGTAVSLTGSGTLPSALYMLELRSTSRGAHHEYKKLASVLLDKLSQVLDPDVSRREKIGTEYFHRCNT